jgi:hypothetical protein
MPADVMRRNQQNSCHPSGAPTVAQIRGPPIKTAAPSVAGQSDF